MELIYQSIVLLGCIFLDWALLSTADEGEWFFFLLNIYLFSYYYYYYYYFLDVLPTLVWVSEMSN